MDQPTVPQQGAIMGFNPISAISQMTSGNLLRFIGLDRKLRS